MSMKNELDVIIHNTLTIQLEVMLRKYPNMERFSFEINEIIPITTFLELNPNIRTFETNSGNLWGNRDSLKTSKVTLDNLAVRIDCKNAMKSAAKCKKGDAICQRICVLGRQE